MTAFVVSTWERLLDGVWNWLLDDFGNDSVDGNFDFVPDVVVFRVRLRNSNSQILGHVEWDGMWHVDRKFLEERNMHRSMVFRVCRVDSIVAVQNRFDFRVIVR